MYSLIVQNTGQRSGQEVVQLYVRDEIASLTRPIKLLRGFEKVSLAPGEQRTIQFTLGAEDFGFREASGKLVLERGRFTVMAGPDSENLKSTSIELV